MIQNPGTSFPGDKRGENIYVLREQQRLWRLRLPVDHPADHPAVLLLRKQRLRQRLRRELRLRRKQRLRLR